MSWLILRRGSMVALLVAIVHAIALSTGCNGGVPSGSVSKAANNVGGGAGGGGGGGGGGGAPTGPQLLRMIAWDSGQVSLYSTPSSGTPAPQFGADGDIWCFVTTNGATANGAAIAQPTIYLNGAAQTVAAFTPMSLANPAPTTAPSWFLIIQTGGTPANANLLASATVGTGTAISNTVVTKTSAFPAGNTFAGGFTISSPIDAFDPSYVKQPPAVPFTFAITSPSGVSSYQVLTLYDDLTGNPQFPVNSSERTTPGTITAGSATGISTLYLNDVLPSLDVAAGLNPTPASGVYEFQVIALDSTGWGVGSTVDSPSLAQWIWFGVQ